MEPTIRLYEEDSHRKEFDAEVVACAAADQGAELVLKRTCFFPEGGGQSCDTGRVAGYPVIDVQEKQGIIVHRIQAERGEWESVFQPGKTVHGEIDWEKRFSTMQQHTGEHIVSGLIHREYGCDNVGFHLGSADTTLDFNSVLTEQDIRRIERKANETVAANLTVRTWYPAREERERLEYRSKKEIEGALRLVEIPGIDICACCAPHVSMTGEIGLIKLTGVQKYKGGVRIAMQCGFRALEDYNRREASVREISMLLSVKPNEVSAGAEKLKDDYAALREKQSLLYRKLCRLLADQIKPGSETAFLFEEKEMGTYLRTLANLAAERVTGYAAVFTGNEEEGYQYILAASAVSGAPDMKPLAVRMNEALCGRGGGSREMVQGTLMAKRDEIEAFFGERSNPRK